MLPLLTKSTTFILGDISNIFGIVINAIYNFFNGTFGIESIGITIIVFTILVRVLMLPLAIKQQKSQQEMQRIQPELKKLQDKYKDKKDQATQQKYQQEMQELYKEHGVNPFGGCLPILVQMPIIFSLFAVLRNIPAYITSIKDVYLGIIGSVQGVEGFADKMTQLNVRDLTAERVTALVNNFDVTNNDLVIDLMAQFSPEHWTKFGELFSSASKSFEPMVNELGRINEFLTINLAATPELMSVGILIPILCFVAQILVTKTMSARTQTAGNDQAAQTQKTMTYMMPIITVFFVMQMPAGLGVYWLTSNVFQLVQQIVINKYVISHPKQD